MSKKKKPKSKGQPPKKTVLLHRVLKQHGVGGKQARPVRPRNGTLRNAYKNLISAHVAERMAAYATALQWYDKAVRYAQWQGMTADQLKLVEEAAKHRLVGIQATDTKDKISAFRSALRDYEKACEALKPLVIDPFLELYQQKALAIEERNQTLEQRYGSLLGVLREALKPVMPDGREINLSITLNKEPFRLDSNVPAVVFNRQYAKQLRIQWRREGLLAAALTAAEPISRCAALEKELDAVTHAPTGRYVVVVKKQLAAYHQLMQNLFHYARHINPRLVRRAVVAASPANGEAKPKRSFKGFRPGQREKVDGLFVVGSARANIYSLIKDEKVHTLKELAALPAVVSPVGSTRIIAARGRELQKFDISWPTPDSVQLKFR